MLFLLCCCDVCLNSLKCELRLAPVGLKQTLSLHDGLFTELLKVAWSLVGYNRLVCRLIFSTSTIFFWTDSSQSNLLFKHVVNIRNWHIAVIASCYFAARNRTLRNFFIRFLLIVKLISAERVAEYLPINGLPMVY